MMQLIRMLTESTCFHFRMMSDIGTMEIDDVFAEVHVYTIITEGIQGNTQ